MPRCPLCKTQYADGVGVCKIDGTRLAAGDTTRPVPGDAKKGGYSVLVSGDAPKASGKGRNIVPFMSDDEVTTAAKKPALAVRGSGQRKQRVSAPPKLATGSGPVAPKSQKKDEWAAPFLDVKGKLADQRSEDWVGQTLGSYKLLSILGKGGMGCVYRAEHTKLGRDVALKVLRTDYAKRKDAVARFFQEARAVNKVRHRNIVDVTDLVELDEGIVFIIMEYLQGAPLTKLMRKKEDADPVRALSILVQICDGLAAAHSVGIVHRDLKPDNIIVVEQPGEKDLVKILDFGVAKLLDKDEGDDMGLKTVAGSVVGTPAFMSPEQAGGLQVDGRADIYSLGAIMYEIFTKSPIFRGKSFGDYVRMHLNDVPLRPSLRERGRHIDPGVERVIMRCLEKSPDARFHTAQELRAELLALLATLETTGEMTEHLSSIQPAPAPIGDASPSPPGAYAFPGTAAALKSATPAPLMRRPAASQPPPHSQGSQPAILPFASPHSIHTDSGVQPMHGYGQSSIPHSEYPPSGLIPIPGHSQAYVPQSKNRTGLFLATAIAIAAAAALLMTMLNTGNKKSTEPPIASQAVDSTPESTVDQEAKVEEEAETKAAETKAAETKAAETKAAETRANGRQVLTVKVDSDPPGAVFAVGVVSPVCKETPCELRIDTADGGSPDRRDFVVRLADHQPENVTVNLREPREKIFVALRAIKPIKVVVPVKPPRNNKSDKTRNNKSDKTPRNNKSDKTPRGNKDDKDKNDDKTDKEKCKAGAQDTFNPFGEKMPCK